MELPRKSNPLLQEKEADLVWADPEPKENLTDIPPQRGFAFHGWLPRQLLTAVNELVRYVQNKNASIIPKASMDHQLSPGER